MAMISPVVCQYFETYIIPQHSLWIWDSAHGVCLLVRHHGQPSVQAEGGEDQRGGGVCGEAQEAVPQLPASYDWQVGPGAHQLGSSRRLLLWVSAQRVAAEWEKGPASKLGSTSASSSLCSLFLLLFPINRYINQIDEIYNDQSLDEIYNQMRYIISWDI